MFPAKSVVCLGSHQCRKGIMHFRVGRFGHGVHPSVPLRPGQIPCHLHLLQPAEEMRLNLDKQGSSSVDAKRHREPPDCWKSRHFIFVPSMERAGAANIPVFLFNIKMMK